MIHSVKKALADHATRLRLTKSQDRNRAGRSRGSTQSNDKDTIEAKTKALSEASTNCEKMYAQDQGQAGADAGGARRAVTRRRKTRG